MKSSWTEFEFIAFINNEFHFEINELPTISVFNDKLQAKNVD